jgi:hypothetical protein
LHLHTCVHTIYTILTSILLNHLFFYYCAGWRFIVAYTESAYNVSNISYLKSSFHYSPCISLPHSWNSFSKYHFLHLHNICTVFAIIHPFPATYPFAMVPLPQPLSDHVLPFRFQFCRRKKKKNDIFAGLR